MSSGAGRGLIGPRSEPPFTDAPASPTARRSSAPSLPPVGITARDPLWFPIAAAEAGGYATPF